MEIIVFYFFEKSLNLQGTNRLMRIGFFNLLLHNITVLIKVIKNASGTKLKKVNRKNFRTWWFKPFVIKKIIKP